MQAAADSLPACLLAGGELILRRCVALGSAIGRSGELPPSSLSALPSSMSMLLVAGSWLLAAADRNKPSDERNCMCHEKRHPASQLAGSGCPLERAAPHPWLAALLAARRGWESRPGSNAKALSSRTKGLSSQKRQYLQAYEDENDRLRVVASLWVAGARRWMRAAHLASAGPALTGGAAAVGSASAAAAAA